jgi:AcrR family transcriptional regulator
MKRSAKAAAGPAVAGSRTRLTAGGRRSQILKAAMKLFAERGFHGVRTRELADSAGVSEALVFRHFPTKESIVRAILDEAGFAERIQEMEARLEAMPPREALLSIAESLLTRLKEHPDRFRVVFFGLLETPHLASEFYQRFLSRLLALETRIFKRAFAVQGSGLPGSQVDPSVVARSFHGSLMFYNLSGAIVRIEPLPKNPKRLAEAIVDLYLPAGSAHGR